LPGLHAARAASPPATQAVPLPPSVQQALRRARVPADALAVVVHELDRDRRVLHWREHEAMNPASLAKLVTTMAALDQLGAAFQWQTPVFATGPLAAGVLDGDLVIRGNGDPTLVLERVWLLKVLDRLDDALVVSEQSVRLARMAGTRKDLLRARVLHATIQQFRGAYAAAIHELNMCVEEAEGQGWAALAAFACQHRGKTSYDAGDYPSARADFKKALFLRQEAGAPEEQLESTLLAIEAADRRRAGASVAS
jgi:tetratricopeptide (TPR) repeat protein